MIPGLDQSQVDMDGSGRWILFFLLFSLVKERCLLQGALKVGKMDGANFFVVASVIAGFASSFAHAAFLVCIPLCSLASWDPHSSGSILVACLVGIGMSPHSVAPTRPTPKLWYGMFGLG